MVSLHISEPVPAAGRIKLIRPVLPSLEEIQPGIEAMLRTGMVTKGSLLREFEQAVADHLNVRHAIGVSSCTTGLMLTCRCLGLTGDVVVPSFTFMATISALVWAGLRPVFADVDIDTATLDPEAVESAITPETSAILAVHNFGNPADIDALQAIADRHNLKLMFDAAHGFGARYRGLPVGSQGDAQAFSLSPTKLLIAGEGGIVATNDDALADRLRAGREYGNAGNYDSAFAGMNGRMAEFNALLGLAGLARLPEAAARRNEVAALYRAELSDVPGVGFQEVRAGNQSSYKDFSITIDAEAFGMDRDALTLALQVEQIETRAYYDPPAHRQTAYQSYYDGTPLPATDALAAASLSLPIWSDMDDETVRTVSAAIQRAHRHARSGNIS
jgi:dTDP-4-amino-4,6-dideoxygalactose transaminase